MNELYCIYQWKKLNLSIWHNGIYSNIEGDPIHLPMAYPIRAGVNCVFKLILLG